MISTKLGYLPSSALALVLATSMSLAPVQVALAAPAEGGVEGGDAGEASEGAPEGETTEGAVEGEAAAEGETPPVDIEALEGEDAEGEEVEAPEDEDEGEGEDEDEGEEALSEEEVPTSMEDLGPMRPPEPTWGPKNQYPRNGKGMLITGGLVTGLGAAFIVTSVLITRCDFDSALSCKYGDQRNFLVPTAVATTGLGLLLIGVGVGNHLKYKKWQNWTPDETALVPSYVPGGGGLAWVGRF